MKDRNGTTRLLSWALAILLLANLAIPALAADTASDFVIDEEGELTGYTGAGGTVRIPDSVTAIGKEVFKDCTALTKVTIPDSVEWLRASAFEGCTGLTSITIPKSVSYIGNDAFRSCTGLTSVTIPESVSFMGDSAFRNCTGLESVTFLGDTEIDNWSFSGCASLSSVKLPATLLEIAADAFDGTPWLKKANAAAPAFKIVNGVLFEYNGPGGKVAIPGGVVRIESGVFAENSSLTEVVIPDSVRVIGDFAFYWCENLAAVTIGSGVELIEDYAFYYCESLRNLKLPEDVSGIEVRGEAFSILPAQNKETRQRLYEMLRNQWVNLADCVEPQSERITKLSKEIAGRGTDYEKAKAICNWVSKNIKYDYEYYSYGWKDYEDVDMDPESILDTRLTVCVGFAKLANCLMQAQGIPALYVLGSSGSDRDKRAWGGHAWSEAYLDGRWVLIDTTWGPEYFDMNLAKFTEAHQADTRAAISDEDIPSGWARAEVWEAMTEGLLPPCLQSDYRGLLDREEICELLVNLVERASGERIDAYLKGKGLEAHEAFPDTENSAVLAAVALGFVSPRADGDFDPNAYVKRQEAAVMLARAAEELGLEADGNYEAFADEERISSWAKDGVALVACLTDPVSGERVMGGEDSSFRPGGSCCPEDAIVAALRILHCAEAAAEKAA